MAVPYSDWLSAAKQLPVGQSVRIRHAAESRANLVIANRADAWVCWCHACNAGGRKLKEHVLFRPTIDKPERAQQELPDDRVPLLYSATQYAPATVLRRVAGFLCTKGLDLQLHLPLQHAAYSARKDRLLVQCEGQGGALYWLGRALGGQQPKWVQYSSGTQYAQYVAAPHAALVRPHGALSRHTSVVLVEDYLSALKVQYAAPHALVLACLGTSVSASLVLRVLDAALPVQIFFDGDAAGSRGSTRVARRLRGLGVETQEIPTPAGADPKDLRLGDIRELLYSRQPRQHSMAVGCNG